MNQDAKKALDTIKILQGHDAYNEADGIAIINNLMKRAVADYRQWLKDQQEGAIEIWKLVDSRNGESIPGDYDTKKEADSLLYKLRGGAPDLGYYNYEPMLFREVMDND